MDQVSDSKSLLDREASKACPAAAPATGFKRAARSRLSARRSPGAPPLYRSGRSVGRSRASGFVCGAVIPVDDGLATTA